MSTVTIQETFTINDVLTDVTSVVLSDPTAAFGIMCDDTSEIIEAAGTALTKSSTGIYTHTFTEPLGASGYTYTYWVEWVYGGETYRDEKSVSGAGSALESVRVTTKYVDWIKAEFLPLTLATPDSTIEQCLENTIRYWNTHSGFKCAGMYSFTTSDKRVQISPEFKHVVSILPSSSTNWIWDGHPLWTLTGVTILDNVTSDLIMMSEAYRNYREYVGTNMDFTFEKSDDPSVGGYLYITGFPSNSDKVYVLGTKRITAEEDITSEYILDWVLNYAKNLVQVIEGNTLRKAGIVDIKNDGQDLISEAKIELERLRKQLSEDSRWVALARRI